MKFDLVEINRLSPLGLWDLGILVTTITMLRRVISESVIASGTNGSMLLYGRMVVWYSEGLREKTWDNLNMRIKAWVLQCPARIDHVRGIIGAATIRRWRKNRLADYALTKYFGDWKRKWPDGFKDGGFASKDRQPKRQAAPEFRRQTNTNLVRAYKWKLFALVKIMDVRGFLFRKRTPNAAENAEEQEMRDAYYKLWGVESAADETLRKWTQPRVARTLKPIRFTPDELEIEPEEAAETSPSIVIAQDAPKRIEGEVSSASKPDDPPPGEKPP